MTRAEKDVADEVALRFHQIEALVDVVSDYISTRPDPDKIVVAAIGAISAFARDSASLADRLTA